LETVLYIGGIERFLFKEWGGFQHGVLMLMGVGKFNPSSCVKIFPSPQRKCVVLPHQHCGIFWEEHSFFLKHPPGESTEVVYKTGEHLLIYRGKTARGSFLTPAVCGIPI